MTSTRSRCILAVAIVAALPACTKRDDTAAAKPDPSAAVSATRAAPSVASVPASLPAVPERKLPAGKIAGESTWLPSFKLVRYEGDAGLSWLEAHALCASHDREVCTEAQWKRACGEDDTIGKAAAWTMTFEGKAGFVVRGGSSCSARSTVAGFEKSPARGALCCDRAMAIETTNGNAAFLSAVSAKLAKMEKSLNQRSASALAEMCDDELEFYAKPHATRAQAESLFSGSFRQWPDQWVVHGLCHVTLQLKGSPELDTWTAECDKTAYRAGEVAGVITKYVFGGPETKIRSITEPRLIRNWSPP